VKYACGHKADLSYVTKDQVRAARTCRECSPEGRAQAAKDRQQMRESERRNMLIQASLDAIGMSRFGPLAGEP
jgi:hypothetical protein